MSEPAAPSVSLPAELRVRLAEDLAAGKTIALSPRELEDPGVRAELPAMLDELSRQHREQSFSAVSLPGYTMLGEIAQGGQSTVHLARQEALGRHVAVKIPDRWTGHGDRSQQRFLREARAMARLSHPNIVAIHDIVEIGNSVAIAMEWIDGLTLASLIRALPHEPSDDDMVILRTALGTPAEASAGFGRSVVRFFVRLVHDVARAVQTVHDAGLLHLDIKPSNVLVRRDGTPLLADFGVVREMTVELTSTKTFAGTLSYAPPEQLRRQDARIGPRTDVYSLGMTLYEALAREPALRNVDLADLLQPIEGGRVPRLSGRVAIAADLENIVHKAIAPEPEHRYASAAAFADDLLAFLEHRPVVARPLSRAQRLRRWVRNQPWKAALAGALVLLVPALLGLGTYLLLQLPELHRIETEARWRSANQLKQAAYQSRFGREDEAPLIGMLEDAMRLDPSDSSLACLVAAVNEVSPRRASELLAAHPDAIERSLGLRLARTRAAEGRSFFDADEAARLRASTALTDKYVLALDRLDRADDSCTEEDYAEAVSRLEEAVLIAGTEPLLYGLLAWATVRAGDRERFDAVARAIGRLWPNDVLARAWPALALEHFDRETAIAIARDLIALDPSHPRGWEILVGSAFRSGAHDEVLRYYEQAKAAGAASTLLEHYFGVDRALAGEGTWIERVLEDTSPDSLGIRLLAKRDPAAALRRSEQLLADPNASPRAIRYVYDYAKDAGLADLQRRAWDCYRERYPDRVMLDIFQVRFLWQQRELAAAAKLAPRVRPRSDQEPDNMYQFLVRILLQTGDWAELLRAAERWSGMTTAMRQEASYFVGLAAARLGDRQRAAEALAVALCAEVPRKSWQVRALLEDAWLHTAPDAPPELRDPALAAHRLAEFERRNPQLERPHRGQWTSLVTAEVRFANGDRDAAAAAASRGLRMQREQDAPPDVREMLTAALQRYRQ